MTFRINQHGATFHFSHIGTPITWGLVAIYGGSYGMAHNSAQSWYERPDDRPDGGGQYIVEIDRHHKVVRHALFFNSDYYRTRQDCDDGTYLTQWVTFPFEVPEEIKTLVTEHLRETLKAEGYLIPREDWVRIYPGREADRLAFHQMMADSLATGPLDPP